MLRIVMEQNRGEWAPPFSSQKQAAIHHPKIVQAGSRSSIQDKEDRQQHEKPGVPPVKNQLRARLVPARDLLVFGDVLPKSLQRPAKLYVIDPEVPLAGLFLALNDRFNS